MNPAPVGKTISLLKKEYPHAKYYLKFSSPVQLLVAAIMSAQARDETVNATTNHLFKKYKTANDFAEADPTAFTKEISSIPFFRNKAKAIIGAAGEIQTRYRGAVPRTERELIALPGIGYKTAHVILGELFDIREGIATDTHVKRFAYRFDLSNNTDLTKISKDLEALIPKKDWKYVNNGLVLYGRYVCPARPHDCASHPLTKFWPPAVTRWVSTDLI